MIRFHSPVIFTKNLEEQKRFYTEVLLQEIDLDFGRCITLKCGISLWEIPENHPIAKTIAYTYSPDGNKNLELCFETEYFDSIIEKLNTQHLNMMHSVIEENWGQRTIRFYDPEQNIIELGESIQSFVLRMHKTGMTVDEINLKTSVPADLINEYVRNC